MQWVSFACAFQCDAHFSVAAQESAANKSRLPGRCLPVARELRDRECSGKYDMYKAPERPCQPGNSGYSPSDGRLYGNSPEAVAERWEQGISTDITIADSNQSYEPAGLLAYTDSALHCARREGRDRVAPLFHLENHAERRAGVAR